MSEQSREKKRALSQGYVGHRVDLESLRAGPLGLIEIGFSEPDPVFLGVEMYISRRAMNAFGIQGVRGIREGKYLVPYLRGAVTYFRAHHEDVNWVRDEVEGASEMITSIWDEDKDRLLVCSARELGEIEKATFGEVIGGAP